MSMTVAPMGAAPMSTPVPAVLQPQPVSGGGPSAQLQEALLALHGALGALRGALEGAQGISGGGPVTGGGGSGCGCRQATAGEAMVGANAAPEATGAGPVEAAPAPPAEAPKPEPAAPAPPVAEYAPAGFKITHPLPGAKLTSHYGEVASIRGGRPHTGTDLAKPSGTPILSAAPGKVLEVGFQTGGLGNFIKIDHGNGWTTSYGHMVEKSPLKVGDAVKAGDQVGKVGSTGNSTGPHLHFMVLKDGKDQNPEPFLSGEKTLG